MPIRKRPEVPSDSPDPSGQLLDLPLGHDPPVEERESLGGSQHREPLEARGERRDRGRKRSGLLWLIPLLAFPIGALVGYFSYADPPAAALSTDLLDFGETRVTEAGEALELKVSNRGERVLWITAVTLLGEGAKDFSIVADECAGLELGAAAECLVRVAFTPSGRGPHRARVEFESNDPSSPTGVVLTGLGVMPELSFTPSEIDLGAQTVGRAGSSGDLQLGNRGTAPLLLGSIEIAGDAAADFLRVSDTCSSRRLEPGGRCSLRFTFVPRADGERRAEVRIEHDAAAEATTVRLLGQAVSRQPILELVPAVVDFGALPLGATSPDQTVVVANSGNGDLQVRSVRLDRSQGVGGEAFELISETCTESPVAPGEECVIAVRFESISETGVQAVLEIVSSASSEPERVLLTGLGSAAHALVDPLRLRFGEVGVRASSRSLTARLVSSGTATLRVSDVAISGADGASFSAAGCASVALAAGEECAVEVRFQPQRPGPHRAELVLSHNADERQSRLPLNGLGVTARLSLEPEVLDFGDVSAGNSKSRLLTLANSGRADLEIRRLRLTGGRSTGFELADDRCSRTVLRPSETCRVTVLFRATSAGPQRHRLTIEHSAAERPRELPLQASSVPRAP